MMTYRTMSMNLFGLKVARLENSCYNTPVFSGLCWNLHFRSRDSGAIRLVEVLHGGIVFAMLFGCGGSVRFGTKHLVKARLRK